MAVLSLALRCPAKAGLEGFRQVEKDASRLCSAKHLSMRTMIKGGVH